MCGDLHPELDEAEESSTSMIDLNDRSHTICTYTILYYNKVLRQGGVPYDLKSAEAGLDCDHMGRICGHLYSATVGLPQGVGS